MMKINYQSLTATTLNTRGDKTFAIHRNFHVLVHSDTHYFHIYIYSTPNKVILRFLFREKP